MAADQWRAANTKRGAGYRSRTPAKGVTPAAPAAPPAPPAPLAQKPGLVPIVPQRAFVQQSKLPDPRPPLAGPVRPEKPLPSQIPAEPIQRELVTSGDRVARSNLESLEASLQAAIDIETEAHAMVLEAQKDASALGAARLPPLISSYGNANSARMSAEKAVRALQREEKILIPLDEAKSLVARVWGPVINKLRNLPKRASKANPMDKPFAEEIISVEVEALIGEVEKLYTSLVETGEVEEETPVE